MSKTETVLVDQIKPNFEYNYQHFNAKEETRVTFTGPKIGERAYDFKAFNLSGEEVRLSDYKGKTVVIESGSFTCPSYINYIKQMNELDAKYSDIIFLMLYVREAHPGGKIGPHVLLEDKIDLAKKLSEHDNEQRTILVDDINGTAHKNHILLPNFLYIINPDGVVTYRSEWNDPKTVEKVIKHIESLSSDKPPKPSAKMPPMWVVFPVMKRGGWRAIFDMIPGMPRLMWSRAKLRWNWHKSPEFV